MSKMCGPGEQCGAPVGVLDRLLERLVEEAHRYNGNHSRLVSLLEVPQTSECCGDSAKQPAPEKTVQFAIGVVTEVLVRTNEQFEYTMKRLAEQVGEFKILS